MPLYFFDVIDNGVLNREGFHEARDQAIVLLPDIARDELPDGERHTFACWVRDERDRVIYRGTLTYEGERSVPDD